MARPPCAQRRLHRKCRVESLGLSTARLRFGADRTVPLGPARGGEAGSEENRASRLLCMPQCYMQPPCYSFTCVAPGDLPASKFLSNKSGRGASLAQAAARPEELRRSRFHRPRRLMRALTSPSLKRLPESSSCVE